MRLTFHSAKAGILARRRSGIIVRFMPMGRTAAPEVRIMIIGAHSIVYSKNPEADRAFLRDVLKMPNVDVGGGWLIFGLPPAEVAVHPSKKNDVHEFYLMCDDVEVLMKEMKELDVECSPVHNE